MQALNDPSSDDFEPTVMNSLDLDDIRSRIPKWVDQWLLEPYIRTARSVVRVETDVIMVTHLLLYFTTSVPSAMWLFHRFHWAHGLLHFVMQAYYVGTYTLMRHQHIHMRGILAKRYALFDNLFPYFLDPLLGHSWNSYYYHHVKHHHIEGNGPDDLSSTIRYQRDDIFHFLHYVGRFLLLVWIDLPLYFFRKGKIAQGCKAAFWEWGYHLTWMMLFRMNPRATFCTLVLPLCMLRLGLMIGNWGQHAFVDDTEPDSDYRSSITLIDVAVSYFFDVFTKDIAID